MRTRATTSSGMADSGSWTGTRQTGAGPILPDGNADTPSWPYTPINESIVDQLVAHKSTGYCLHLKEVTRVISDPLGHTFKWGPVGGTSYTRAYARGALAHLWARPNVGHLSPVVSVRKTEANWARWGAEAVVAMRPTVEDGLLLPNFLGELAALGFVVRERVKRGIERADEQRKRDLRNVPPEPVQPKKPPRRKTGRAFIEQLRKDDAKELANLRRTAGGILRYSIGAIERLAKKAAWINLAYQFAVRPTVQDAQTIARLIESWRSALSELIRRAGLLQRRHYRRPLDIVDLPVVSTLTTQSWNGKTTTLRRHAEWITQPVLHASMVFTYDATRLQGLLGKLDAALHAFGVSRVASIIWEAIPFSFVVDWFVNVGDMLHEVERLIDEPLPIVIHDLSLSVKFTYQTSLRLNWGGEFETNLATRLVSNYERRRVYPTLWDLLSVRLPNLNQAGLGLSLIIVSLGGIPKSRGNPRQYKHKPLNFNRGFHR